MTSRINSFTESEYINTSNFSIETLSNKDVFGQIKKENEFKQEISLLDHKQKNIQLEKISLLKNQLFSNKSSLENELMNKYDQIKELYFNKETNTWNKSLFMKELWLSEYFINDSDFDLEIKNDALVIISKSSYFSSLTGLNWLWEKGKSRNLSNRYFYDEFDKISSDLLKTNISDYDLNQKKSELIELCRINNIDFYDVSSNWGSVIQWVSNDFIWIKQTALVLYFDSIKNNFDYIEKTIVHEKQHIKFDIFLKKNNISQNGYLKILNEVIAHCCNVNNPDWSIDFQRIIESMSKNQNYIEVSGFSEEQFIIILKNIVNETEVILNWNNDINTLDSVMLELINRYSNL